MTTESPAVAGRNRNKAKVTLLVAAFGMLTLLGLTVWPTPYRYDTIVIRDNTLPVRINRFTGNPQMLMPGTGWKNMSTGKERDLRKNEITGLKGYLTVNNTGEVSGFVDNTTDLKLTQVTVFVEVDDGSRTLFTGTIDATISSGGSPKQQASFTASIPNVFTPRPVKFDWHIAGARGVAPTDE